MSNKFPFLVQDADGNLVAGASGEFIITALGAFNGAPRPAPTIIEDGGGYELQATDADEAYGTAVLVDVGAGREPRYYAFAIHKGDNSNFFFAFTATTPTGAAYDAGAGTPGTVNDWTGPLTPPVVQLAPALFVVRPTADDMAADASGRVDMAAGAIPAHYSLGVEPYVAEATGPTTPGDLSPVVQPGDLGTWPDGDLLVKLGTIELSPGVSVVSLEEGFDFELAANDLRTDAGLQNAVALSLFCDARASADEEPEAPLRRGWWGERLLPGDDAGWGSKTWLLDRSTISAEVRERRRRYDVNALQWLVDDGIAARVEVTVEAQGRGFIETINIYRPGVNDPSRFRFASVWEAQQRRT